MVGGSEHKVVLDKSGSRVYCVDVDCGLYFLSVLTPADHLRLGAASWARIVGDPGDPRRALVQALLSPTRTGT